MCNAGYCPARMCSRVRGNPFFKLHTRFDLWFWVTLVSTLKSSVLASQLLPQHGTCIEVDVNWDADQAGHIWSWLVRCNGELTVRSIIFLVASFWWSVNGNMGHMYAVPIWSWVSACGHRAYMLVKYTSFLQTHACEFRKHLHACCRPSANWLQRSYIVHESITGWHSWNLP